jgi:hypothetical protein
VVCCVLVLVLVARSLASLRGVEMTMEQASPEIHMIEDELELNRNS